MERFPLYILAGGRSSRFGSDKARAILHGRPLIRRIAEALEPVAEPVRVIAERAGKYADLGLETIPDGRPGLGPLSGLETALLDREHQHGPGWLILCSCDLLEARPGWIRQLHAARMPGTLAAAFAEPDGDPQPMLALYHTDLLPRVREHLEADQRSMRRFLGSLGPAAICLATPSDWPARIQANRPEELAEHERATRTGHTSRPGSSRDNEERNHR